MCQYPAPDADDIESNGYRLQEQAQLQHQALFLTRRAAAGAPLQMLIRLSPA